MQEVCEVSRMMAFMRRATMPDAQQRRPTIAVVCRHVFAVAATCCRFRRRC